MSKNFSLFKCPLPSNATAPRPTNWDLCALCQDNENYEKLVDPRRVSGTPANNGYKVLADKLIQFNNIDCMPMNIRIQRLDEGDGIEQTFITRHAKWHRACYSKFNSQKLQRAQKRKAEQTIDNEHISPVKTRRFFEAERELSKNACFFCNNKHHTSEALHKVQTFQIDTKVRECAKNLLDREMLAKLAGGDMVAQDAVYHLPCLSNYYYRGNKTLQKDHTVSSNNYGMLEGQVIAELVSYIEETGNNENITVFKLSDLSKLYESRLRQLQPQKCSKPNSTRLKERILKQIPSLKAETRGREVLLMFEEHLGDAIHKACLSDDDSVHLMRTAQMLRKEILGQTFSFDGSFHENCEQSAVPQTLLTFISMILKGTNIKDQKEMTTDDPNTKIALSLSQLLMFNIKQRSKSSSVSSVRHNRNRETPLPIYLSLMVHAKTRKRTLVDKLHNLGLGISYDRLMNISTALGNKVCAKFDQDGIVCPPKAKKDVFTVGCMDNIDHNPSSSTCQDSFHGTAVSIHQFPTAECPGTIRDPVVLDKDAPPAKHIAPLPQSYATVPAVALENQDINVPVHTGPVKPTTDDSIEALAKEWDWLKETKCFFEVGSLNTTDYISWAAYHANIQPPLERPLTDSFLLPMFHESAHTPAMVLHAMKQIQKCTEYLNPGQTPIMAMDQPLYALAKQLQWQLPEEVGESKFVVMMGGLHIEMALSAILGQWLARSGWTAALVKAGVTTVGRADETERGNKVKRSRYAHQVTAASLYLLLTAAYDDYTSADPPNETVLHFEEWCKQQCDQHPQFLYWFTTLELELKILLFIRSLREANFPLYRSILAELMGWFFIFDHTNYARWLPVHLRDMMRLEVLHPEVYQDFLDGRFVVQKTSHLFSCIALDQAHEQENAKIKGDGGAVGLTESASALHRWMVAGPEVARLVAKFEESGVAEQDSRHHEQYPSVQKSFHKDVTNLCSTLKDMGNPFLEDSEDLVSLESKDVMDASIVETLRNVQQLGKDLYGTFVDERLCPGGSKYLSDTIPKNKVQLFDSAPVKQKSQLKLQVASLKADNQLFSRLFISCQVREGNLTEFFQHENHSYPPSLSVAGKLRHGAKSDLIGCLLPHSATQSSACNTSQVTAKVFDGPALVHMLIPKGCKDFDSYARDVFIAYIRAQLENVDRLDVVWDIYKPDSLKHFTREIRGTGTRRKVYGKSPIPKNWQGFLRVDENKTELFTFLAGHIKSLDVPGKQLYATEADGVLSSPEQDEDLSIAPSTHEEADARIFLHVAHCVKEYHSSITIRTVDTDVVVLAVACFPELAHRGLDELFVAFGVGKTYKYIPCHEIAQSLGNPKSRALPVFHALTGSDTTSSFANKGKKSAWEAWNACPAVTNAMVDLSKTPTSVTDQHMEEIERFVIVMYSKACSLNTCDEARRELFTQGSRTLEHIPPTSAALRQHVKRAAYQAGYGWGQCLLPRPQMPDPADWGWTQQNGIWEPFWTSLAEASKSCYELVHCKCKVRCNPPCKCALANLKCTELCVCKGACFRSE